MLWLRRWQRPRRPRPLPWCWLKATNGGVRVGSGRAAWEGRRRCLLEELVLAPEAWESKCAGGRRMIGGVRGPTAKTGTQSTGTARTRQGTARHGKIGSGNLRLEVGTGVGVAVLRGRGHAVHWRRRGKAYTRKHHRGKRRCCQTTCPTPWPTDDSHLRETFSQQRCHLFRLQS